MDSSAATPCAQCEVPFQKRKHSAAFLVSPQEDRAGCSWGVIHVGAGWEGGGRHR